VKKSRRRKKRGTGKVLLSQNAPSPGVFPHFCSFAVPGNNAKKANNEFFNSPTVPVPIFLLRLRPCAALGVFQLPPFAALCRPRLERCPGFDFDFPYTLLATRYTLHASQKISK